jgi:hypothetical protein
MADDVGEHKAYLLRARMPDDHKHGSVLRAPEFGILDFRLKAGGKESKFFLPEGARKAPKLETGDEGFHFAPVKETIEIRYEVNDPFGLVDGGKIEIFTRFDDKPLGSIDLTKLGSTWLLHGPHIVKWDGRVVAEAEQKATEQGDDLTHDLTAFDPVKDPKGPFPDGYLTLEHPPYKLRLTLTSKAAAKSPAVAWTYAHILIKKIEFELGTADMIPKVGSDSRLARDKAVRKSIEDDGGVPADGGTRKVWLRSNVYKTASAEMDDNTAYTEYEKLWKEGPNIPIIAKIRIADSADAEVKLEDDNNGLVLGKARFMWDWRDPDEVVTAQSAKPRAFLTAALNYYKAGTDGTRAAADHTYPKGDNCHVDHGGKRGPNAKLVFDKQDGYAAADTLTAGAFPFEVKPCTTRKWASFSRGWTTGLLKGKTGAVFRPSRMAGDDYKIYVYLDYDRTAKDKPVVDVKTEPLVVPAAVVANTGKWVVWRRIHVVRYVRKDATVTDWTGSFGAAQAFYRPAFMEMVNGIGGQKYLYSAHRLANGAVPTYNAFAEARLVATGNSLFTFHLVQSATANHAADAAAFRTRLYEDFVQELHKALHTAADVADFASMATDLGSTATAVAIGLGTQVIPAGAAGAAGARNTRLQATKTWLVNGSYTTRQAWATALRFTFVTPLEGLLGDLQCLSGGNGNGAAPDGITVVHFDHLFSGVAESLANGENPSMVLGAAIDVADATRNRCLFFFTETFTDTFAHEVGHHLFLPHAPFPAASPPGGAQANRHDAVDDLCTMSYKRPRTYFCGLCQLRLRGWSATALQSAGASNTKP